MIISPKQFSFTFVLFIPILFALAQNTTPYFPPKGLNPGTIRAFIMVIFLSIFVLTKYPNSPANRLIFIFTIYIGLLCLLSSNIGFSLYAYMKFFIATMLFPIGYYYINNHNKLLLLSKIFMIALGLFIFNMLIANIFKLGTSDYLEDSFYFGAGRVNITKSTLILLFASIVYTNSSVGDRKRALVFFLILSSFITIIGIKRSVLLSAFTGFSIFAFSSESKLLFIRSILTISFVLLLSIFTFPKTLHILTNRFEAREEKLELTDESLDKESRISEVNQVLRTWVDGSVKHKLIGSEMFNDRYFFNTRRMLHTDYMVLIAGSGIIGITLWLFMFIYIIMEKEKYWKILKHEKHLQLYNPIFYSIIASQFLMSISGTIQGVDLRGFIMLFLGGLVGSLKGEYKAAQSPELVNQQLL